MNLTRVSGLTLLVLAITCMSSVKSVEVEKVGEVLVLNQENYRHVMTTNKAVFVKFYTEWCPHCKTLKPKWVTLAKYMKDNGHDVKIAMINADENPELTKANNVRHNSPILFVKI